MTPHPHGFSGSSETRCDENQIHSHNGTARHSVIAWTRQGSADTAGLTDRDGSGYTNTMNTYYVYAVIHRRNEDAYVGCTSRIESRWTEHKRRLTLSQHSSPRLQAAWDQDGEPAFAFVILTILVDATRAAAKRDELAWIARIGSYNEVKADQLNQRFVLPTDLRMQLAKQNRSRGQSAEQRENMRQHTKRRWADPEQRKALLRGLQHGNGFYKGMPSVRSPEQIAISAERMKETWADPERNAKLKARQEARWKDPDAKQRQAEKMRAYHAARRASEA